MHIFRRVWISLWWRRNRLKKKPLPFSRYFDWLSLPCSAGLSTEYAERVQLWQNIYHLTATLKTQHAKVLKKIHTAWIKIQLDMYITITSLTLFPCNFGRISSQLIWRDVDSAGRVGNTRGGVGYFGTLGLEGSQISWWQAILPTVRLGFRLWLWTSIASRVPIQTGSFLLSLYCQNCKSAMQWCSHLYVFDIMSNYISIKKRWTTDSKISIFQ